ncbi:MAG TPA: energy transducer TonB [Cytophagales bacterium]|nr:energy transducer TonB [Cytophagales bacterium]HAA24056.1 energy transducer TonB [Cytophagales bacterium]HAP64707.1 energy transducer TonB [Cytophagales bacterium]
METKKNPKADLQRWSQTFMNIGLSISIGIVVLAFNYTTKEVEVQDLGSADFMDEIIDIPITEQKPPDPPKPKILDPIVIPVEPEEAPEIDLDVIFSSEDNFDFNLEDLVTELPPEETVDEPFEVVEVQAAYPGGTAALLKYLAENIQYPSQARRMGIQGRVFVKFIVEKDGSVSQIQVERGIGAGCDEAAVKALENMPKWSPGRQRGVPVRQWMHIPVNFNLK